MAELFNVQIPLVTKNITSLKYEDYLYHSQPTLNDSQGEMNPKAKEWKRVSLQTPEFLASVTNRRKTDPDHNDQAIQF